MLCVCTANAHPSSHILGNHEYSCTPTTHEWTHTFISGCPRLCVASSWAPRKNLEPHPFCLDAHSNLVAVHANMCGHLCDTDARPCERAGGRMGATVCTRAQVGKHAYLCERTLCMWARICTHTRIWTRIRNMWAHT